MTITKERVAEFIKNPLDNGLTRGEQMELARMALAGMEAEPVAARYRHHNGLAPSIWKYVDSVEECNSAPNYQCQELYTAPQPLTTSERAELENYRNAQQVVPGDFDHWWSHLRRGLTVINAGVQRELQLESWVACRAAMQSGAVKDGWVMVPVEPTHEMLAAAKEWTGLTGTAEVIYREMLAAAPQQEAQ